MKFLLSSLLALLCLTTWSQDSLLYNIAITGGYENFDDVTHSWQTGLRANFKFKKHVKWSQEFGISYVEQEFNRPIENSIFDETDLDSLVENYSSPYGSILGKNTSHFRKQKIRFQIGINRKLIEQRKHSFNAGINTMISVTFVMKEEGEQIIPVPIGWGTTTVNGPPGVLYSYNPYGYSLTTKMKGISRPIIIQLHPFLGYSYQITEHIDLGLRAGFFFGIMPDYDVVQPKLNAHIGFSW